MGDQHCMVSGRVGSKGVPIMAESELFTEHEHEKFIVRKRRGLMATEKLTMHTAFTHHTVSRM